tara:strand:- start:103 stop:612 length:510 start_codon:yes stop_codon:yes gene_type:complete
LLDNLNLAIVKILESRKYQLQRQIIEALKSNDSDLYSLLKSQWAHRFGVESLEELKNLDFDNENQNLNNSKNQEIDIPEESSSSVEKAFHIEEDVNQEKEMRPNAFDSIKDKDYESNKVKPPQNEIKEGDENTEKKSSNDIRNNPRVEALIPLPPKPKYSYLKKWLLRK